MTVAGPDECRRQQPPDRDGMDQSRIDVIGERAAEICTAAWCTYLELCAGRWAALADATADRWVDVTAAGEAFEAAADGIVPQAEPPAATLVDINGGVRFRGPQAALCQAVELWQRAQLGQFDHAALAFGGGWPLGERFDDVRASHGAEGAWPAWRHSSWGVHSSEVSDDVRVAYDIWKLLGGGMCERPTITGRVSVRIDGRRADVSDITSAWS